MEHEAGVTEAHNGLIVDFNEAASNPALWERRGNMPE